MINDKWLDLDKQNIVELQSVDGVLDSMKVNGSEIVTPSGKITITENGTDIDIAQYATADVNVEGGGGSSDFSIAEVTVACPNVESQIGRANIGRFYYLDENEIRDTNASFYDDDPETWEPLVLNEILYKGSQIVELRAGSLVSTSGAVTFDSNTLLFEITGDCTINVALED